jgi:hypothetical protein
MGLPLFVIRYLFAGEQPLLKLRLAKDACTTSITD